MSSHRRTFLLTSLGASLGLGAATLGSGLGLPGAARAAAALQWRERPLLALGTTLNLRAAHASGQQAEQALDAAVARIRAVEASMSLFQADSELQRLNRTGQLARPSADLLAVLQTAQDVALRSGGAFDCTVQPLWSLYDRAARHGRLPDAKELAAARALVGWRGLNVQADGVSLTRPGMAVTLNGIAQGYAADVARAALQQHGIEHALLDAGEFATLGRNPAGQAWTLGIEDPRVEQQFIARLRTDGRGIATSADNRSAFTPDHRHHHILNPATGRSPTELASVTVAAPATMLADALTKVMFMAGPRRIPALAQQWNVGVLWVDKRGRWAATPDLALA
jgi:thiamine biosynthesis lipoprotein